MLGAEDAKLNSVLKGIFDTVLQFAHAQERLSLGGAEVILWGRRGVGIAKRGSCVVGAAPHVALR